MGNPDVSGVGPTWYVDGTWPSGTINSASADYGTALSDLQASSATYLAAKDALTAAITGNVKATINAAKATFDAARADLGAKLLAMKNANDTLAQAAVLGRTDIDDKLDDNLILFNSQLHNVMDRNLTLPGVTINNLDSQFSSANTTRITARSAFLTALNNFFPAQNSLNALLVNFQSQNDVLFSLQAKYAADQAPPPASAAVLAADVANINAQIAVINAVAASITSSTATRDSRLATLQSAFASYQTAIDNQITILNQAAQLTQTSVASLLADLQTAKNDALLANQAVIDVAKTADTTLHNQLLANFPNVDPIVTSLIENAQAAYVNTISDLNNSSLAGPKTFITQINIPTLPPAGRMSMSQLMQFITLVEVLLDQLIREIRRTDSQVNQLRLAIFSASGANEAFKFTEQSAWGNKVQAADTKYNARVALDNYNSTQGAEDWLDSIDQRENLINSYIDDLNDDIDDQNARGIEVVTALNSAIQMAADNYKVQLWADYEQLNDYQNQLQTTADNLATTDPLRAPLQTVSSYSNAVLTDLQTISGLLGARPIDEAAISAVQGQLATDQANLATAIGALPAVDAAIQSMLTGFTNYSNIVIADQSKLQTHLHNAEVNAALALSTQVDSESTRLANYSQDITRVIGNLNADDPTIPLLQAYKDAIDPVVTAMNSLSSSLTTLPLDLATIAFNQTAVNTALSALTTQRSTLVLADLDGPSEANVLGVDETLVDLQGTFDSLTQYTTSTSSSITAPPLLPGQVQVALMPPPIQLEHFSHIDISSITIPSSLPLPNLDPRKPSGSVAPPELPPTEDIAAFNKAISQLNQQLAPVLDRLHEDGHDEINLIDPIFIRQYVAVRDPASIIDFSVLESFATLLSMLIQSELALAGTKDNLPTNALASFSELLANPNLTADGTSASGVGAGVAVGGANLLSAAGNVSQSLSAILSSTEFTDYVKGIFEKSGVIAGLAALGNLSNKIQNYSRLGIIQPQAATAQPTGPLTADQKIALGAGVQELLSATEDVPKLKQDLLAILKSLGAENLTQEEINQLLSLLLFLLQLVALLVAAVAVAAGGGETTIDKFVEKAFEKPADKNITTITNDLRNLGVKNLPLNLAPSNPQFIPVFFNAISQALTPAVQLGFVAKVTAVFTDRGITVDSTKPLGQAVQEALTKVDTGIAAEIRQQLNKLAEAEADKLRSDILRDENRRPSVTSQIKALNPEGFAAIPEQQVKNVSNVLNNEGPNIPGLSAEDRNSLVLAILGGIISPAQAKGLVDQFLKEGALKTNPVIGNLLAQATGQVPVIPETRETGTPTVVKAEERKIGTPTNQPGSPGQLPDVVALLTNAFKALSKQTTDQNFSQEVVTRFSDTVREQSDFYQKSLTLILDPANTYVKNFSIMSRQTTGHDGMDPTTQIPISG